MAIRVLVWNEGRHEQRDEKIAAIYPEGIHGAIASWLRRCADLEVETATMDSDAEHGCQAERLGRTDVMIWWGHMGHEEVLDAVVERVYKRVLEGMGFIALHSAHASKVFKKLMGTSCDLKWRDSGEREVLWATRPGHPILKGIDDHFVLDREEMYGEYFDIPEPQETILISSFAGGEVFRSGVTFGRGAGRVFYFRPGHESFPTYYDPTVLRVIENAVRWATAGSQARPVGYGERQAGWIVAG